MESNKRERGFSIRDKVNGPHRFQLGHKVSKETRAKQSLALKGKRKSAQHRQRLSEAAIKRFKDPKEREKASLAKIGTKLSLKHRVSLSKAQLKRYTKQSERDKQTAIAKELWKRESYRRNIIRARKNSWKDPFHRSILLAGVEQNRKLSICNTKPSKPQMKIFNYLAHKIKGLEPEYRLDRLRVDIANPINKRAVEVDGWHHQYFDEIKQRDKNRDKFLASIGWKVLRLTLPVSKVDLKRAKYFLLGQLEAA